MTEAGHATDPELDLVLEREFDVPPHLVWAAWTTLADVHRRAVRQLDQRRA